MSITVLSTLLASIVNTMVWLASSKFVIVTSPVPLYPLPPVLTVRTERIESLTSDVFTRIIAPEPSRPLASPKAPSVNIWIDVILRLLLSLPSPVPG